MSVAIMKTANHIHYFEVLDREIPIEGKEQKVTICNVLHPTISSFIEDLRELNAYRKKYGKLVLEDARQPHATGTQ